MLSLRSVDVTQHKELKEADHFRPYRSFVEKQTLRNPSLSAFSRFLTSTRLEGCNSRITEIRFPDQESIPTYTELKPQDLQRSLKVISSETADYYLGRIIIVEDLTRQVVEDLGHLLNIDPFFFASHLYAAAGLTSARAPPNSILPSRRKRQNFTNVLYHRIVQIDGAVPEERKLRRHMNIPRRTVLLPKLKGIQMAVIQHAYSVLRTERPDRSWLCIMLVDPPLTEDPQFLLQGQEFGAPITLRALPFQGGYEDFLPPELGKAHVDDVAGAELQRCGMFEDLVFYWTRQPPCHFDLEQPTIVQLSQHALRIIAAEWVNYETLLNFTAKEFEYTIPSMPDTYLEVEKLNANLKSLQSWLRRSKATQIKIQSVIHLIESEDRTGQPWSSLLEDCQHLRTNIEDYGRRLETMLPMVASFVQIIDTRRSLAETANISRLTYLAVIFVPLSYVTGIFSMNADMGPGGAHFWVYFVVAIPMAILVFLIARPPIREVRSLLGRSDRSLDSEEESV